MKIKKVLSTTRRFQLNWGIKTDIKKLLLRMEDRILIPLETAVLFPITNLANNYFIRRIVSRYGADYKCGNERSQNLDKATGNLGYGLLHYALVRNIRPENILCIGSMYGFIPFMCAMACKHNKKGKVDFVDAGYDVNNPQDIGKHNFGQGFWKKVDPKNHFSFFGVEKWIKTYVMTSEEFARKYPDGNYEYIYVDGDHSYKGVKKDYRLFWPRLKKKGLMVFHDVDAKGLHGGIEYDVTRLWQEVKQGTNSWLYFPNAASGLGIIQKL